MLWEASIAMMTLMFLLWGAAIWASYEEHSDDRIGSGSLQGKKAA